MLLQGRIALVTGASRGIGAAAARRLATHGAAVAVNFLSNEAAAMEVVEAIVAAGGRAVSIQADVRDPAQAEALVRRAEKLLGPVDTLVLNANMNFPMVPFADMPWEGFQQKLLGEVASAFHPCKAALPGMIQRRRGCIIAVSSGLSRQPGPGFSAHTTAKSGPGAGPPGHPGERGRPRTHRNRRHRIHPRRRQGRGRQSPAPGADRATGRRGRHHRPGGLGRGRVPHRPVPVRRRRRDDALEPTEIGS